MSLVEDYAVIGRDMRRIQGECRSRDGRSIQGCWCYKQGPDGKHLPCPPLPRAEEPRIDPLRETRDAYQRLFGR